MLQYCEGNKGIVFIVIENLMLDFDYYFEFFCQIIQSCLDFIFISWDFISIIYWFVCFIRDIVVYVC